MKMKTVKWKTKLQKRFNLPDSAKIIFFQNPDCFGKLSIERINPNHKINILARPKKRFAKSKPRNKIRVGRIDIPIVLFFHNQLDKIIYLIDRLNFTDNIFLLMSYFMFSCAFVYLLLILTGIYTPFKEAVLPVVLHQN